MLGLIAVLWAVWVYGLAALRASGSGPGRSRLLPFGLGSAVIGAGAPFRA